MGRYTPTKKETAISVLGLAALAAMAMKAIFTIAKVIRVHQSEASYLT
jgi:hypothetical protein